MQSPESNKPQASGWLERRSAIPDMLRKWINRPIPQRDRWRRTWISLIAFLFVVQCVTGLMLLWVYSASTSAAWGSVWQLQTQNPGGWFLRGLHIFASDALIISVVIHLGHLLWAKLYFPPFEAHWWIGLALVAMIVAAAHTGYLLPWDQNGYWGTIVRTNILSRTPVIGNELRQMVLGGSQLGQATLTRFHALHVAALPVGFILLLLIQRSLRSPGSLEKESPSALESSEPYWPHQLFRHSLTWLLALSALAGLAWYYHSVVGSPHLQAPADASASDYPARPEWYFRCLFELLKHFQGPTMEVIGSIVVPSLIAAVVIALPFARRFFSAKTSHRVSLAFVGLLAVSACGLTAASFTADRQPPDEIIADAQRKRQSGEPLSTSQEVALAAKRFHDQRVRATQTARRVIELAATEGIPPDGPLALLENDWATQGPVLFAAQCASCHRYDGHDGLGNIPVDPPTSSDLAGFGTQAWIRALLENPMAPRFFGRMKTPEGEPAHTRMSKWIANLNEEIEDEQDRQSLNLQLDAVAFALSREAVDPGQMKLPPDNPQGTPSMVVASSELGGLAEMVRRGREFFLDNCNECHSYEGERTGTRKAPEMYGYGSIAWIERLISDPSHDSLYRSKGREPARMPSMNNRLTPKEIHLVAKWLNKPASGGDEG